MKKTLSLSISILLLMSVLASCASDADTQTQDATTSIESVETTTEDTGPKPDLPEVDLDGYTFRVLTRDTGHHIKEVYSAEQNGEVLNDAVFNRNLTVEQQFGVKLEAVEVTENPESVMQEYFRTSVMSNEDAFDVALMHTLHAGATATEGTAYNWHDIEYIDFDKPWWNSVIVDELTYNDKLFLAISDYCISAIDYTWSMLYNYGVAEDYGVTDVFDLVDAGSWTLDKFTEYAKKVSTDLNGDSVIDHNDRFGFTTHYSSAILNWAFASDIKYVERDASGAPVLLPPSEKNATLIEKLYALIYEGDQTLILSNEKVKEIGKSSHDAAVADTFSEGRSLFAALRIQALEKLRAMEGDYGIIPFPKFDEQQEAYYTHVDGHAPLMIIPKTIQNTDKAGIIFEALAYESYKQVVPAVEQIILQEKYSRDETSSRMLNLILDGRVYTFGNIHDTTAGMQWIIRTLIVNKSTDYASFYAKVLPSAEALLNRIIDAYESIGE